MKVLILAGSLYQTVPEAPIDSSQQQRFFHMSLERDLKKAGIVLPPDSHWRRNFLVNGKDPLEARAIYDFSSNSAIILILGMTVWGGWTFLTSPVNFDVWSFVGIALVLTVIVAGLVMTMNTYDSGRDDLESTVKKIAEHLNISVIEVVSSDWTVLHMRAESHLKTLAIELDRLRHDNDLDPLSIELPALQAKFKRAFDDFKLAKLIPEDATYVRYFPAPAGKK